MDYNVGRMLNNAGKHYCGGIIKKYSIRLTNDLGKGYTFTALTRMEKFFVLLEKLATVSQHLSYGHYVELMPYDDIDIDENVKDINHEKTIGIIICKQNNKYVIKYCSDERIIFRTYELV